jgi:hypothetical protein
MEEMAEFASLPFVEQMGVAGQQVVVGPVFDVAAYGQIVAALKIVAMAGTVKNVVVNIEQSMDMDKWSTLVLFTLATVVGYEVQSATKFARYVRVTADTSGSSADLTVTFSVLGIARSIG